MMSLDIFNGLEPLFGGSSTRNPFTSRFHPDNSFNGLAPVDILQSVEHPHGCTPRRIQKHKINKIAPFQSLSSLKHREVPLLPSVPYPTTKISSRLGQHISRLIDSWNLTRQLTRFSHLHPSHAFYDSTSRLLESHVTSRLVGAESQKGIYFSPVSLTKRRWKDEWMIRFPLSLSRVPLLEGVASLMAPRELIRIIVKVTRFVQRHGTVILCFTLECLLVCCKITTFTPCRPGRRQGIMQKSVGRRRNTRDSR